MKYTIIYSHPNPQSFNHAILETVTGVLKGKKHELRLRDLYAIDFYPVLRQSDFESFLHETVPDDIREEQKHIAWADVLIFIFPLWWTGLPALVKGYIDRVFSHGFAYAYGQEGPRGLLSGKEVLIFNTMGAPEEFYAKTGMLNSLARTIDKGIFEFCAMKVIDHKYFGEVPLVSPEERHGILEDVKRTVEAIV